MVLAKNPGFLRRGMGNSLGLSATGTEKTPEYAEMSSDRTVHRKGTVPVVHGAGLEWLEACEEYVLERADYGYTGTE